MRTSKVTAVPAGVSSAAFKVRHVARLSPASKTRDVKVPELAYEYRSTYWTCTLPPPVLKSLAIGRSCAAIAMAWVATRSPSTK